MTETVNCRIPLLNIYCRFPCYLSALSFLYDEEIVVGRLCCRSNPLSTDMFSALRNVAVDKSRTLAIGGKRALV